jgi:hypothetical protein
MSGKPCEINEFSVTASRARDDGRAHAPRDFADPRHRRGPRTSAALIGESPFQRRSDARRARECRRPVSHNVSNLEQGSPERVRRRGISRPGAAVYRPSPRRRGLTAVPAAPVTSAAAVSWPALRRVPGEEPRKHAAVTFPRRSAGSVRAGQRTRCAKRHNYVAGFPAVNVLRYFVYLLTSDDRGRRAGEDRRRFANDDGGRSACRVERGAYGRSGNRSAPR